MSHEIDTLRAFYAAINRNDLDAAFVDFDDDVVRIEPEGFPTAGTYRGLAAVRANVARGRGTWAEGTCEMEGFERHGDRVVALLHAHVRLHGRDDWVGGRFADGFEFRQGRVVRYLSFGERADALRWACVPVAGHGSASPAA